MSRTMDRRFLGVVAALTMAAAIVAVPAGPSEAAPQKAHLAWSTCYQGIAADFGVEYECAQLNAPLDYDSPRGAAIQLAMVRLPARGESQGSIFLNPGGPGGSGIDFALFFGPAAEFFWGPDVRDNFDIVGFDPRGVGRSTALRCFGNLKQSTQAFPPINFPLTEHEIALFEAAGELLANQCDQRGNKILEHMSTANVARDMDLMREAVGDDGLNFVGLSYGSFLGSTYANLFPDRVRAVVIDGVLDPIAWANVEGEIPFSTRLRSDQGALDTLERFFSMCEEAADACALYPDPAEKFDALATALLAGPLLVPDPFTGELMPLRYDGLIGLVLGALYNPFSFPLLAEFLAAASAGVAPAELGMAFAALVDSGKFVNKRGFPKYPNFVEAFPAVACEDGVNPTDLGVWWEEGLAAEATHGYFGRIWTWASSPCADWPAVDTDAYRGPFTAETSNTVLVIGNLYDPATRYQGAEIVRGLLPNSALVTVDIPGHTSLGLSFCAGAITGAYLMDPTVGPAVDGAFCPEEFNPFLLEAAAAGDNAGMSLSLRRTLMEVMGN